MIDIDEELDMAVLPSLPSQRGSATAQRAGLQFGESLEVVGAADAHQKRVADELATQFDEDRRSANQTRLVLLATAGRGRILTAGRSAKCCVESGRCRCRASSVARTRINSFCLQNHSRRELCRPERRSARSINVCERTDEPWRLPAKMMCRVQRKKVSSLGQRECVL